MLRIKESSGFPSQTWGELGCPCSGSSCLRWKGCITPGEPNCQDRAMIIQGYTSYFQINEVMCVKIRARKNKPMLPGVFCDKFGVDYYIFYIYSASIQFWGCPGS